MKHLSTPAVCTAAFLAAQLLMVAPAMAQTWQRVPTPNPSAHRNLLRAIDGTSTTDIWAVGDYQTSPSGLFQYTGSNLIMHWDGSNWTNHTVPNPGLTVNTLWDVTAVSPSDAWAVGDYESTGSQSQLLHWNGTSWASQLPANMPTQSFLWGIDAISGNDIWAVGGQVYNSSSQILPNPCFTLHYNGSTWTEVPVPTVGQRRNRFTAVHGISTNDVWAVGTWSHTLGAFNYLAMHWDGTAWTNFPIPASIPSNGELLDVHMVSSNDVWAVGDLITGGMVMLHWDGTSWSQVASNGGGGAFASVSSNDVYAVGNEIAHWDGTAWTKTDSLNNLPYPALADVVYLPGGELWAAGRTVDASNKFETLVMKYNAGPSVVSVSAAATSIPSGGSTQLTATPTTTGSYSYRWSPGATLSDSTIANPVASPSVTATYTVTATNTTTGETGQASVTVTVNGTLSSTAQLQQNLLVQAYPNPFTNQLQVTVNSDQPQSAQLTLTDALGRFVSQKNTTFVTGKNNLSFTVADLSAGHYLLSVKTASQLVYLKLMRQ